MKIKGESLLKMFMSVCIYNVQNIQGGQKWVYSVSTQNAEFILVLLNYCIIFYMNNYRPTFALPCTPKH